MIILQGRSALPEISMGTLFFDGQEEQEVIRRPVEDPAAELVRFRQAVQEAGRQLDELYEKSRLTVGEADAAIFQIQRLLLEDEKFHTSVCQMIEKLRMNVEYAVRVTGDNTAQMLRSVEDVCIRERAQDVLDITKRLLDVLTGGKRAQRRQPEQPYILAAEELLPSEAVLLDREKVLGFALGRGSLHSHTAILAKSMGVPALFGLGEGLDRAYDGKYAALDGKDGILYIEPDRETLDRLCRKKEETDRNRRLLEELKGKPDVTTAGRIVRVYANAGNLADVEAALANDAGGIGLFRSEMQYLEASCEPTEEELTALYRQVLEKMNGREVIIRTFDLGADKRAGWLGLEPEENPALGLRAIRLGLVRRQLLQIQLQALYRAGTDGQLSIMYPMITSTEELRRLRQLEEQAKEELRRRHVPFAEQLPRGIMIETPAAALLSAELASWVDFFSVGTNDLTQYTLALDRQNVQLEQFDDPEHKAVLRLIEMAAQSARAAGIRIGICGDLAADTSLTERFVEMGIDELSVSPGMVLQMRRKIREI